MFYIKADILSANTSCPNGTRSSIKLVQQDDLYTLGNDPFNKPSINNPLGFFEDGDLFIWTENDGTLSNVLITFIKTPARMKLSTTVATSTNCELSEHMHKEIVQMAVDISLENLQSPRVQSNVKNTQSIE